MASANSVQQQQQQPFQQQQQPQKPTNSTYSCKDCGIYLNSAESLEVHLDYHKDNLLSKWASQAGATATASASSGSGHSEETNNNTTKTNNIKREFLAGNSVSTADSSDSIHKKSPDYVNSSSTPETNNMFGHPPTPQSYQSASSPYQNAENAAFSPQFPAFQQQVKVEPSSPVAHYQNYFQESQFFNMDPANHQQQQQQYAQEYGMQKFRYHPYGPAYDRAQQQVAAFPPQPTPSPSPKQCDKCGCVCESTSQLVEHLNIAHPPTPASHLANYTGFMFGGDHHQPPQPQLKGDDNQSEILDLDSHKVHQVYPEDEKRQNGEGGTGGHPHSVSAMLGTWQQQQHKMFQQEQHGKMYQSEQKMFQTHHHQDYMGNGVPAPGQEQPSALGNGMGGMLQPQPQPYRPFEHLPPAQPSTNVITSGPAPAGPAPPAGPTGSGTKSANWKSNEARRPKTYNCTACNKWFTSSGHLKRHYNTTLHKNAVKSSGQPDPATLPISAHHHPARESSNRDDSSGSPGEDTRLVGATGAGPAGDESNGGMQFERVGVMPGLLQQPPNGPYDRQPPNIHHPPSLQSPMPPGLAAVAAAAALPNGGSPNGEAGPSPTTSLDSRGLLLTTTPGSTISQQQQQPPPPPMHGFNMASPMMAMEGSQFQIYPNELAPHVTQDMAISSLSTTGEFHQQDLTSDGSESQQQQQQPLPSFAQFHIQRMGVLTGSADDANVGGGGAVTAPFIPFYSDQYMSDVRNLNHLVERADQDIAVYEPIDQSNLCNGEELIIGYPEHPSPCFPQHSPNYPQSSPEFPQTSPAYSETSPTYPQTPTGVLILANNTTISNNNIDGELDDSLMSESDGKHSSVGEVSPEMLIGRRSPQIQRRSPEVAARFKRGYEEVSKLLSTQTDQHKCFECDKKFNKPCYLTQHNKTFHSGDKPFKCQTCGKRFSTEPEYSEHQKKHNGDKPHKCELCPKQFNHKTDLRRHMCLHTGLKPYTCETCGKGFIRKDHMLKHCETHLRKIKRV